MKTTLYFWLIRLVPAIILLQTLFYKFSAVPETVYIFTTLGLEPYGRIGLGVLELVSSVLLLIPSKSYIGAAIACGLMIGAIFSHLFVLGITVKNDKGLLFILALVSLLFSVIIIFKERNKFYKIFSYVI